MRVISNDYDDLERRDAMDPVFSSGSYHSTKSDQNKQKVWGTSAL